MRSAYVGGSDSVAAVDDHLMSFFFFNPASYCTVLGDRFSVFGWKVPVLFGILRHCVFERLFRVFVLVVVVVVFGCSFS